MKMDLKVTLVGDDEEFGTGDHLCKWADQKIICDFTINNAVPDASELIPLFGKDIVITDADDFQEERDGERGYRHLLVNAFRYDGVQYVHNRKEPEVGQVREEINLPFTTNAEQAQKIARQSLEALRDLSEEEWLAALIKVLDATPKRLLDLIGTHHMNNSSAMIAAFKQIIENKFRVVAADQGRYIRHKESGEVSIIRSVSEDSFTLGNGYNYKLSSPEFEFVSVMEEKQ